MTIAAAKACDFFWIPFRSDCEELLGRFQQTESVRFEQFASLWREMNFSTVFHGMTTNQEKRAFTRLAFATVYSYFLPPYSFQIRVGALYMFYGLYHTQLPFPKEKIWLALKDWVHVQKFVLDALSFQHLDIVYIYKKLESEKVFLYTAMPKQLTFDAKRRFLKKDINEEFQDRSARVAELINTDTLEEIANIQSHYERIMKGLPASSLISVTPVNLTAKLQECVLEFQQWQEKQTVTKNKGAKQSTQQMGSSLRANLLASIKSKSYSQLSMASRSRRHRQVDMDTPERDYKDSLFPRKCKPPSLRARTWQNLGKSGVQEERTHHWLLSSKEEDKTALKRNQQKNRFKW